MVIATEDERIPGTVVISETRYIGRSDIFNICVILTHLTLPLPP